LPEACLNIRVAALCGSAAASLCHSAFMGMTETTAPVRKGGSTPPCRYRALREKK